MANKTISELTEATQVNNQDLFVLQQSGVAKKLSGQNLLDSIGAYIKPSSGIPKTDLASAVQASLDLADSALQSVPDTYRTSAVQDTIDATKQPLLPTAVNDGYLHANASTGALEWKAMPQELAVYDLGYIPNTSEIYADLQNGKLPIFVYNSSVPERGIYICNGGEYENDVLTYYFLRVVGNTVRYFKQNNLAAHQWSGQGSYAIQTAHTKQTVTLTAAGWSNSSQTVSVSGVTAGNTVIVAPAPASVSAYGNSGIYCSAQGAGTLTFTCSTTPTAAISVNVAIFS